MQIHIELPDGDVAEALMREWADLPRRSLEAVALEGYRSGALSESQVRRLLGFDTRLQVHEFLKISGVFLNYTEADLREDIETHRRLGLVR